MMPLRRNYSHESIERYSERSLHADYIGQYGGGKCMKKKL